MTFPNELYSRLWHTTSFERYESIIKDGYIFPEPDSLPDNKRWKTKMGTEYYPFVRTLGGVSLFDFNNFEPESYSEKFQSSSWRIFVPFNKSWDETIWIEIDRSLINDNFISGEDLLVKWHEKKAYKNTLMPIIECAHIGAIPISTFCSVLIANSKDSDLKEYIL